MKKFFSAIICLMFSVTLFLSSCTVVEIIENPIKDIYIISNTERYYIDETPRVTGMDKVKIELAKNETEGGQFYIRSDENEYKNLSISIGELTDGKGNEIPAENIKLYREMFIKMTEMYGMENLDPDKAIPSPHPLIPMEYEDLNNTNTVKGENTAFYFTVETDENTTAGIYSGEITLKHDEGKILIPVEAEVWDITLPETPTYLSAMAYWTNFLTDYTGYSSSDSEYKDILQKVFDMYAEYKITPGDVPPEILGNYSNTEEYALRIKEYLEKYPQFTGVHIPFYVTSDENRNWIVTESDKNRNLELYDELRKLGIIDKVYIYSIDEPSMDWQFQNINALGDFLNEYAPDVKNIVTTGYRTSQGIQNKVNTWCPIVSYFEKDKADYARENFDCEYWWYFCNDPPAPTAKIFADMSNTRISGWMAKNWDIKGILYWCTNVYMHYNSELGQYIHKEGMFDTDNYIYQGMEGDGIINRNIPIATLSLEAIRDSIEDYEYATLLEKAVAEKINNLGLNMTVEEGIESYYNSLYISLSEFPTYEAPDNISVLRRHVANDIINGVEYIMTERTLRGDGNFNAKKLEIYADKDTEVKVNGRALSPSEATDKYSKYTYTHTLYSSNEFLKIDIGNKEYIRPVICENTVKKSSSMLNLSADNALDILKEKNQNIDAELDIVNIDGSYAIKITYKGKLERVSIPQDLISDIKLDDYNVIRITAQIDGTDSSKLSIGAIPSSTTTLTDKQHTIYDVSYDDKYVGRPSSIRIVSDIDDYSGEEFTLYIKGLDVLDKEPYMGEQYITLDDLAD